MKEEHATALQGGAQRGGELPSAERAQLQYFERLVYDSILEEIGLRGKTIDPERTSFEILDVDHPRYPSRVVCRIRRTRPSMLDLDIVFGETGPRLDAGPPPEIVPVPGELGYRIWEPDFSCFPNWETFAAAVRPFLRDWIEGRLVLETTYAGRKAFRWILRRGDVILGERHLLFFPYFSARRTVAQHT